MKQSEDSLNSYKHRKSEVNDLIRKSEDAKAASSDELRSLELQQNNLKLDLRTFEVNLDNASIILEKADIKISEINPSDFASLNLEELEKSLAEIQTSISALSSINLAAPDEYLSRQSHQLGCP